MSLIIEIAQGLGLYRIRRDYGLIISAKSLKILGLLCFWSRQNETVVIELEIKWDINIHKLANNHERHTYAQKMFVVV